MLFWISQQIVISLIVIVLIHSIYTFLQNNLTTPKIRDMVQRPAQQYREIYDTIKPPESSSPSSSNMKNELQNYLKELSTTPAGAANIINNPTGSASNFTDNFQTV
jgi:hypothetical protein